MNTRFLISPAYILSIACLIIGAIMAGTSLMIIGWIIFIVGLGINVMALVVLANREALYKAQRIGTIPKAQTPPASQTQPTSIQQPASPTQTEKLANSEPSEDVSIFPHKK